MGDGEHVVWKTIHMHVLGMMHQYVAPLMMVVINERSYLDHQLSIMREVWVCREFLMIFHDVIIILGNARRLVVMNPL